MQIAFKDVYVMLAMKVQIALAELVRWAATPSAPPSTTTQVGALYPLLSAPLIAT